MKKYLPTVLSLILITAGVSCTSTGVKHLDDGTRVFASSGEKPVQKRMIDGYVKDRKTGKPVKGARVEIKNKNMGVGYYLTGTDSDGYFKVDNYIPYIKYIMEISAKGYVTHRTDGTISPGTHTIILKNEARLTGRVNNSSGRPIPGVQVKLSTSRWYGNTVKPVFFTTEKDGSYSFDKLKAGRYYLTFKKDGYITETARIKYVRQGESFRLGMKMYRPASISGKVKVSGLDAPAVNVSVSARGNVTYSGSTFEDGSYRLEDLKPGYYKIKLYHQGFNTVTTRNIRVREGVSIENRNFSVNPKKPRVQVYSYRYTYAPGNKIAFNLRSFRLETVNVSVYSVPLKVLVKGGNDPDFLNPKAEGFKKKISWKEPVRDFRPYRWRYQSLEIKDPLPTGGYCIEVKGAGKILNRKFFTVTSTGVVAKRTQSSLFVYVTDLVTSKPVPNAKVVVFDTTPDKKNKKRKKYRYNQPKNFHDLPVDTVLSGVTDRDGVFHKKLSSMKYLSVLGIGSDGSYAICNTGKPSSFQKEKLKYYIYTDRPVYRAGDKVHYKLVVKKRESKFMPLKKRKVYYKILNRDSRKTITEGVLTLDEWGTANGMIRINKRARLGTHEIRAGLSRKNLYGSGKFYVEQYRKPEFKIDITPSRDYYVNGDTAEFKVEAKYFFGAPLKNALVTYRFYETKLKDKQRGYWWEGSGSGAYNKIKLQGQKYVDANGVAVLKLFSGNYPFDRDITLEATVVDKSNVSITSRKKIRIGRGDFYISIKPSKGFYSSGEKKSVEILSRNHIGKPVSASVKIRLYRYIWKPLQRVYVHEKRPVYSTSVRTGKDGKGKILLPGKFKYFGEFDITAEANDRRDNVITASRVIWIYSSSGGRIASKFKNLELEIDQQKMNKPGNVTCLLKSRYTDAYVCLTLEGRDVYKKKVIQMKGNVVPVTFSIKQSYAPNLYVTATMQRKRALYTASKGVSLPLHNTDLTVNVKTDRAKYKPGDKCNIAIVVKDSKNRPVRADLSLSAVDEAIYQIRRDHTPAMRNFFYTKISNWVLTSYSYPITVLAGAAKEGKVKVREKFEDTAFWKSDIRTDRRGKARLQFTLPDNLTTWRLTARSHDREGRMGERRYKFKVTQDLIARIGKPRFMIEKDKIGLIGIVNSNTKRGLRKVDAEFSVDGKKLRSDDKLPLSLSPFASARKYYAYRVPENRKSVDLKYMVKADRKTADALKLTVPVQKRGTSYNLYGTGDMIENKTIKLSPLKDSDDFQFIPEEIKITLNPSPITKMMRAVKYLSKYPYGCVEQTLNRFIPAMALDNMMRTNNYKYLIDEKAVKNLPGKIKAGIRKVQGAQNSDGTWGWWHGDRGNAFLTGYVLSSLYRARTLGYQVDMNAVFKGLNAAKRMLSENKVQGNNALAYLQYVYALWGRWEETSYKRLLSLNNKDAYTQAYTLRAMATILKTGMIRQKVRTEIKSQIIKNRKELVKLVKRDSKGIYWESEGNQRWSWPGNRTEITAHVLSALVDSGDKSTLASQSVRSISKRARGEAWRSTKETATVVLAFCDYMKKKNIKTQESGDVSFKINGKDVAGISYDLKNLKKDSLTRIIPFGKMNKNNTFNVTAVSKSSSDMIYDVVLSGTLVYKEKGIFSFLKSENKGLSTLSNGVAIARTYSTVKRVKDIKGLEYLVPQEIEKKSPIKIGDEILVRVTFTAQDDFKYMILEDFLPSGFEVINKSAYNGINFHSNSERRDNRMVYFFTNLIKNRKYEIAYILRAELPGSFMVKPARMECMYEPGIQGWSSPFVIEVDKK